MSGTRRPDGYEVPVHQSLEQQVLLGGVPRSFAILNFTLAAVLTVGLGVWWLGLPLGVAVHMVAAWATTLDPLWFDVIKRHIRLPRHLES